MPALHEQSKFVLQQEINVNDIEIETAAWIVYYLDKYGTVAHVWCNPKDRPEQWTCTLSDGRQFEVEPKGGCPRGMIWIM